MESEIHCNFLRPHHQQNKTIRYEVTYAYVVKIDLRCEAIFGPFISRKTIRNQELSLSKNSYSFFSTVRNQITRSYNLHGKNKKKNQLYS
jgi:hypothetical protein